MLVGIIIILVEFRIKYFVNVIIILISMINWIIWIRVRKFKEIVIIVGICLFFVFVLVFFWFVDIIGVRSDFE